jgi:predicted DNA-binding transcriptional regulator YafY
MDMLITDTDEDKGLSMSAILERLGNMGIKAERKSVYDDLETLRIYGMDILTERRKTTEYYVGAREFELPELKLLVDAVQSSKFITECKSMELISKLESLTSRNLAKTLQRQVFVSQRIKTQNESIYYNVDALHSAILKKRKASFRYFYYNVEKKRVYRKDGDKDKIYLVNPLGLSWDDENYYLITYSEKRDLYIHYRVDRMASIAVTDEPRAGGEKIEKFDMVGYCQRIFNMFGGDDVRVELTVDNSLINVMIDRFGKDAALYRKDENHARVVARVTSSNTFFGWLAQFGDKIHLDKPSDLREEYIKHLSNIIKHNK